MGASKEKTVLDVQREKHCPFLLRLFWSQGSSYKYQDFCDMPKRIPDNELQFYTWPDATLRELCEMIQAEVPAANDNKVRIGFTIVHANQSGRWELRKCGVLPAVSHRVADEDTKTLAALGFEIGDYLSISIF